LHTFWASSSLKNTEIPRYSKNRQKRGKLAICSSATTLYDGPNAFISATYGSGISNTQLAAARRQPNDKYRKAVDNLY
jgi:hypothetical protein